MHYHLGKLTFIPNKSSWDASLALVLFAVIIKSFQFKVTESNKLTAEINPLLHGQEISFKKVKQRKMFG